MPVTVPIHAVTQQESRAPDRNELVRGALILTVVLLIVYWPALSGGVLWDDPAHMTKPELRSLQGLLRIWLEPGATQQYYPLTHSWFWLQNLFFGQSTVAHHVVNVLLHTAVAILAWRLLRRLRVPGAYAVAMIWALHPLQVESVAWITEQKNTLSAVFYFAAFWCYLDFDQSRSRRSYVAAFGLLVLGLCSKTVVAALPGAILVVLWWQRGRLEWRRDFLPTLPMFAIGLLAARVTSHMEFAGVNHLAGPDFELSIWQRLVQSGRAAWFYLDKLVWPSDLMFFYPRWTLDASSPTQWIPFGAGMALLALAWVLRGQTRGLLAVALLYVGTLLPALGFVDVYPFKFSYVADHFQYLAGLAPIAFLVGLVVTILRRQSRVTTRVEYVVIVSVAVALALLSWRHSRMFGEDDIALYRETLRRNPAAWIAQQNWGLALQAKGDSVEALEHYLEALRIRPDLADVRFEVAGLYYVWGRKSESVIEFAKAVNLQPWHGKGRFNYAAALAATGDRARAIAHFDTAAAIESDSVTMQQRVAQAYFSLGDTTRAMKALNRAVGLGWRP